MKLGHVLAAVLWPSTWILAYLVILGEAPMWLFLLSFFLAMNVSAALEAFRSDDEKKPGA